MPRNVLVISGFSSHHLAMTSTLCCQLWSRCDLLGHDILHPCAMLFHCYRTMHFSAKCGIAIVYCPSVCPSVTFRYRDHIGWNSSKIISRPNSLRPLLWLTPTWAIWCNGKHFLKVYQGIAPICLINIHKPALVARGPRLRAARIRCGRRAAALVVT